MDNPEVEKIKKWLGTGSINIFGWPFSGKDTQGKRLAELFGASLIGGGEILRSREDIPEHVRKAVDVGDLVPTDEYLQIVSPYLAKQEYVGRPVVLSSVGRWHGEEQAVLDAATNGKHPIKAVIYLMLDKTVANERAKNSKRAADRGQRADDAAVYLQNRYKEFENKTLPVIDFYRQKGLLVEVDGSLPPDEVTEQIISKLVSFSTGNN